MQVLDFCNMRRATIAPETSPETSIECVHILPWSANPAWRNYTARIMDPQRLECAIKHRAAGRSNFACVLRIRRARIDRR